MWLVLCERGDRDALWAYRGLAARGLVPLELVTGDALVAARRWEHRLGPEGASIEVELADGRAIRGEEVRGVLNRLVGIPVERLARAAPADKEYATEELHAFFLSWLVALPCRVLNRPVPQGLSGAWLERSEWLTLAGRAGLSTPSYRRTSVRSSGQRIGGDGTARSVIVVGERALGPPAPRAVVAGCGRLARLAGAEILGVDFRVGAGRWVFHAATPLPALRRGGGRLLDLLVAALRGPEET
jgi:hypothetical protein